MHLLLHPLHLLLTPSLPTLLLRPLHLLLLLQKLLRSNSWQTKKTPQCGVFFRLKIGNCAIT
jgi:hypothetical protein